MSKYFPLPLYLIHYSSCNCSLNRIKYRNKILLRGTSGFVKQTNRPTNQPTNYKQQKKEISGPDKWIDMFLNLVTLNFFFYGDHIRFCFLFNLRVFGINEKSDFRLMESGTETIWVLIHHWTLYTLLMSTGPLCNTTVTFTCRV